eukprot:m.265766 g.265766  ORF g.265766 m.265766 type:complete len:68 (-) comp15627_c0_seq31:4802-5005(-)
MARHLAMTIDCYPKPINTEEMSEVQLHAQLSTSQRWELEGCLQHLRRVRLASPLPSGLIGEKILRVT